MSKTIRNLIILFVIAGGIFYAGYRYGMAYYAGNYPKETSTVYRDRYITKKDTVTIVKPVTRVIYKTEVVLDTVQVIKPQALQHFNLITPSPVNIHGRDVTLTYYDTGQQRFMQNVYQVKPDKWYYGLMAHGGYGAVFGEPYYYYLGTRWYFGYKRISVYCDFDYSRRYGIAARAGVSWDFFRR